MTAAACPIIEAITRSAQSAGAIGAAVTAVAGALLSQRACIAHASAHSCYREERLILEPRHASCIASCRPRPATGRECLRESWRHNVGLPTSAGCYVDDRRTSLRLRRI